MKLGVNIDHIATLREARREDFPDPVLAARAAIAGGANGIVCHLREDRRHINDEDVFCLRKLKSRLDLEMAATDEMVRIALKVKPEMVTLVPEKRQEITTEGGLDVKNQLKKPHLRLKNKIKKLQKKGIVVSLFIDPEFEQIRAAAKSGAKIVEIHTGKYARSSYVKSRLASTRQELKKIILAVKYACSLGLKVNAGHGLDYNNVGAIAKIPGILELNIGYAIIARAVLVGVEEATKEMRRLIN
jgi:pyridoxine 5-phosphate synthase